MGLCPVLRCWRTYSSTHPCSGLLFDNWKVFEINFQKLYGSILGVQSTSRIGSSSAERKRIHRDGVVRGTYPAKTINCVKNCKKVKIQLANSC